LSLKCDILVSEFAFKFNVLCRYTTALEPHLPGEHVKHNDNTGRVETTQELPQAFSHFTLEASSGQLCVCDIQGVGSFYTDPQIHSRDGEGFGMGNMVGPGCTTAVECSSPIALEKATAAVAFS
jgi:hypothetical protein